MKGTKVCDFLKVVSVRVLQKNVSIVKRLIGQRKKWSVQIFSTDDQQIVSEHRRDENEDEDMSQKHFRLQNWMKNKKSKKTSWDDGSEATTLMFMNHKN